MCLVTAKVGDLRRIHWFYPIMENRQGTRRNTGGGKQTCVNSCNAHWPKTSYIPNRNKMEGVPSVVPTFVTALPYEVVPTSK